jgi:hypothetical protein
MKTFIIIIFPSKKKQSNTKFPVSSFKFSINKLIKHWLIKLSIKLLKNSLFKIFFKEGKYFSKKFKIIVCSVVTPQNSE